MDVVIVLPAFGNEVLQIAEELLTRDWFMLKIPGGIRCGSQEECLPRHYASCSNLSGSCQVIKFLSKSYILFLFVSIALNQTFSSAGQLGTSPTQPTYQTQFWATPMT